jgi:ubiquinone/menaquinone biosynthesis C-methylase UbiE
MEELTQKEVWNEIAGYWREFREKPRKEVEKFITECKGKLLDLGCGSGRHFLKKDDLAVYGVDFSEKMLELAKKDSSKKGIEVELKLMKDEEIPYPDEFFDSVLCIAVLHCVETKEKRKKLLEEIKRVLKKGGKAMIQVWSKNQKRVKNKGKEAKIPWTIGGKKVWRFYYIYDFEEFGEELESVGFNILDSGEDDNVWAIVNK